MKRPKGSRVALAVEGQILIHAVDVTGNYATLCGLDGDENATIPISRGRINCAHCCLIWLASKSYTAVNFNPRILASLEKQEDESL